MKIIIFIIVIFMPVFLFAQWDTGSETALLQEKASNGLYSVNGSIAHTVAEIEKHLHSGAVWYGVAANASGGTHVASTADSCTGAFELDAGNDTWGEWVQILGSSDTPFRAGYTFFDPHEFVITDTEGSYDYFIQFARGATGAVALTAGTYTTTIFASDGNKANGVITAQTGRAPAGSKLWARCRAVGKNTATIDLYIGIHEYVGN